MPKAPRKSTRRPSPAASRKPRAPRGPSAAALMGLADRWGAHNYHPLPVVLARGKGVWVWDVDGRKYMDMLSSYSALNQGHGHPAILRALADQARKLTLTSRAFHNEQLGPFLQDVARLTGMDRVLPMNTGAEAVETAIKAARKWAYQVKGVRKGKARIIACENNFHGRTTTIVGFSTEAQYREGFGPFTPGFDVVPYGDLAALEAAITDDTAAFLVEPIQGEAGIILPPPGYLKAAAELCRKRHVLFLADEIQTGFGRTGRMFACQHEGVQPDGVCLGKALGGGLLPVSAFASTNEVMGVFNPGDHGSTFGGNPLACAVARAALQVLRDEKLAAASRRLGGYFMKGLRAFRSPHVREVRGKGLLIGVEIKAESGTARPYCERLMELGILAKETHHQVIRFAPPLVITQAQIDWALERIARVLAG